MSTKLKDWPRSLRQVTNVSVQQLAPPGGPVYLTVWRMNRGTGYADPIEMGAMTVEDFTKFAARVAELNDELAGRGKLLVEKLGGLKA